MQIKAGKFDAIIIEVRAYFSPDSKVLIVAPYTPLATGKFSLKWPKILEWIDCEDFETGDVLDSFLNGIAKHEKGAAVWEKYLDDSHQ